MCSGNAIGDAEKPRSWGHGVKNLAGHLGSIIGQMTDEPIKAYFNILDEVSCPR